MNRKIFSIIGLIILSILIFGAGLWVGQMRAFSTSQQLGSMMGNAGMMNGQAGGMMGSTGMMSGQAGNMMGNAGMMNGQAGGMMGNAGMMNGQAGNMMGNASMMGMMTGFSGLSDVAPLTIAEAETAVSTYLTTLNQDNLALGEIMIFSNNAYAQIMDSETGEGAFEVLVDPSTGNVFPEPGPNMMWNTAYGMMAGSGMMNMMMGGMMGNNSGMMSGQNGNMMGNWNTSNSAEVAVTAENAPAIAQTYLDSALPGTTADEHADTFPGYYTLHIERDGDVIGMLSVNAATGAVFLHHWHGDFIEMADEQ